METDTNTPTGASAVDGTIGGDTQQPPAEPDPTTHSSETGFDPMLSPLKYAAIEALLAGYSKKNAAEKAGVNVITLWRWEKQPDFHGELQRLQREQLEAAKAKLESHAWEAADMLGDVMRYSESGSARVAAAKVILQATGLFGARSEIADRS